MLATAYVLEPIKPKSEFWKIAAHCPMCIGFWVGLVTGWLCDYTMIWFAVVNSFVCYVIDIILTRIQYGAIKDSP